MGRIAGRFARYEPRLRAGWLVLGLLSDLQPVTDEHEHVFDAAVLDLGEDTQPVFGALTAVARPDSQGLGEHRYSGYR